MRSSRRVRASAVLFACAISVVSGTGCATFGPLDRAQAEVRKGENEKAIATLRAHLVAHPEDVAARSLLVRVLAVASRMDLAKAECEALARVLPVGSPRPSIELGHAYELSHEYEKAMASYDEASAMAPTSPDGPRVGGLRAARWGEVELALPRLEEAVRRGATDAETLHALGLTRIHANRLDDAAAAYRLALRLHPEAHESLLGLATVALVKKDYGAALAAYDGLLAARPGSSQGSLGRAYVLAKLGRRDEARRELDRAASLGAPAVNVAKQRASLDLP